MAKFNKLDVPYQWKDEFTKYPHGYTIFEALCKWVKQVDNMVDNINNWNTYLDNFVENFEFELQEEVQSTIERWQSEGLLDGIIESALNTELDNVKTQVAENTNTNAILKTNKSEKPLLGDEMIGDATISMGAGWSGNIATGFTHTIGNEEELTFVFPSLKTSLYQVVVGINKADMSDTGGRSDYYISLGGSEIFETYRGSVTSQVWGIKSLGLNNELIITPHADFEGTLTISIKEILGANSPHTIFTDSANGTCMEIRTSLGSANSIYMGTSAGRYSLQEAQEQNVALGNNALMNNTSGFWNTAIGYRTLRDNTVGSRNVAIGMVALQDNVSGDRNIGIGSFALRRNKTGRSNIGIGADSLWYNDSGNYNIGIGLAALGATVDSNYNIAIGDRAMTSANPDDNNIALGTRVMSRATGGANNIALGGSALYYNAGNNNISIGRQSLYQNRSGYENIAIGELAGQQGKNLSRNVLIGRRAGYAMDNARDNIFIGTYVGQSATTGDNNILIGYQTEKPEGASSNYLNIGNTIKGDMSTGLIEMPRLKLTDLPTTQPSVAGELWNDNGTVKIS